MSATLTVGEAPTVATIQVVDVVPTVAPATIGIASSVVTSPAAANPIAASTVELDACIAAVAPAPTASPRSGRLPALETRSRIAVPPSSLSPSDIVDMPMRTRPTPPAASSRSASCTARAASLTPTPRGP